MKGTQREKGVATTKSFGRRTTAGVTSAFPSRSKELPERAGVENPNRRLSLNGEEVAIAGDQHVGIPGDRCGEHPPVGGIPNRGRSRLGRLWDARKWREDGLDGVDTIGRELQLARQHASQLLENNVADDQVMLSEDRAKNVRAESASGECRNEDVGVEADPHDTARNTSSSVR